MYYSAFQAMGTRMDIVLPDCDPTQGEAAVQAVEAGVKSLEKLLSRFDPQSPVSKLNAGSGGAALHVPAVFWHIVKQCVHYHSVTSGAFDPSVVALLSLWNIRHGRRIPGPPPAAEALKSAHAHTGAGKIVVDARDHSVWIPAGMQLDFGAVGKGIALDEAKKVLSGFGISQGFISFGSSSVWAGGHHPQGPYWPVGIPDLFDNEKVIHTFEASDSFVTTSGLAATLVKENVGNPDFFRYGHTVDPRSGQAVSGLKTVSVMTRTGLEGEVLSTALMVAQPDEEPKLLAQFSPVSAMVAVYRADETIERFDTYMF